MKRLLWLLICLALLAVPVSAEVPEGYWITQVSGGEFLLGSRIVRMGDILTGQQLDSLCFSGDSGTLSYKQVTRDGFGAVQTVSFFGKKRENQPPVAEDSTVETYRNLAVSGHLKLTDPEEEMMQITVTRQPRRGVVAISNDGSFLYTPKKNKVGVDSFAFTAQDASGKTSREATVIVTIIRPCDDARYTDTAGEECCFAAEWMRQTGIFAGEQLDGKACFRPNEPVTRGQLLAMLVKTLEIPTDSTQTQPVFDDDIPLWLRPYVAAALRSGLLEQAAAQKTFRPDEIATSQEAAAMVCAALDLQGESEIAAVNALGVSLSENLPLNRADAARLMYAAYRKQNEDTPIVIWN